MLLHQRSNTAASSNRFVLVSNREKVFDSVNGVAIQGSQDFLDFQEAPEFQKTGELEKPKGLQRLGVVRGGSAGDEVNEGEWHTAEKINEEPVEKHNSMLVKKD
jgi:hypothetical protein